MWDFFYIYTISYMCGAIKSSCGAAIRKSKNQYFKVITKSIMAAQSCKKKRWRKFFAVLHWICIDSSRPYGRLLENQKTGGSRELFLPENDFQTSSAVNFQKNIQISEAWKPTRGMKLRLEFFCTCSFTYELNIR